jgi:hypothetical protein
MIVIKDYQSIPAIPHPITQLSLSLTSPRFISWTSAEIPRAMDTSPRAAQPAWRARWGTWDGFHGFSINLSCPGWDKNNQKHLWKIGGVHLCPSDHPDSSKISKSQADYYSHCSRWDVIIDYPFIYSDCGLPVFFFTLREDGYSPASAIALMLFFARITDLSTWLWWAPCLLFLYIYINIYIICIYIYIKCIYIYTCLIMFIIHNIPILGSPYW